ncbi:MAG: sigma-70 family RNA polymerase sigma factor [Burkholderiales bacterium]
MLSSASEFETMVRAYSGDVYRFCYWICRDRNAAEDLTQETFAHAWAGWRSIRDQKAAKSWLFTIARNEHARLYAKKRVEIDPEQELEEVAAAYESTAHSRLEIEQMFGLLPLGFREPMLLQVLGGFSCAEIAEIMAISEAAVMMRLTRARQGLRKMLGAELELKRGTK